MKKDSSQSDSIAAKIGWGVLGVFTAIGLNVALLMSKSALSWYIICWAVGVTVVFGLWQGFSKKRWSFVQGFMVTAIILAGGCYLVIQQLSGVQID